jgi:sporulation protein YlmC with PRC-barrel domain
MSRLEYLRLGLRVLDEQIVDADGRRCGRVEDIEFEGEPGSGAHVTGILCGATAWKRRLPAGLAELLAGDPRGLRRVSWSDISEVKNEIHLCRAQTELDAAAEGPTGTCSLSDLLGVRVFEHGGRRLGRVADVVASRPEGEEPGRNWEVQGLLIGRNGFLQRAGFSPMLQYEMADGKFPENLIGWEQLERWDEGNLLLRR